LFPVWKRPDPGRFALGEQITGAHLTSGTRIRSINAQGSLAARYWKLWALAVHPLSSLTSLTHAKAKQLITAQLRGRQSHKVMDGPQHSQWENFLSCNCHRRFNKVARSTASYPSGFFHAFRARDKSFAPLRNQYDYIADRRINGA